MIGVLTLAALITLGLCFTWGVISALSTGRIKVEPSQPWIEWRGQRGRFVVATAVAAAIAATCWLGVWKLLGLSA